jgi:hypothetical protein
MLAPILVSLAGLVPAMAEGGSSFVPGARDAVQESAPTPQVFELRAPPKEGRATKVVRELHASLSPAGTVKVVDGVEAKIDKDSARPRLVGEREAWEERTVAVATVDGAARSVHATRRFMELERTIARDAGAELRRRGVVSPLAGAVARVRRRDDGTWERAFEGEVEHDPSCLASVDAEPPLGDLLPAAPVALGERWELAPEAIARALRLDVQELLLPLPKGGEPVPPPRSEIPWRAAKWSGTASVSSADDKVVRIALRLVGEGAWQAEGRPATASSTEPGSLLSFGSMDPVEETLATTLVGELVYDRRLGCCTSLQLKGELRCSISFALGAKDRLVRREQGSFIASTKCEVDP